VLFGGVEVSCHVRKARFARADGRITDLDKANIGRLLAEALTADVEAVLADQAGLVGADAAV